jgi:hypothetical protein
MNLIVITRDCNHASRTSGNVVEMPARAESHRGRCRSKQIIISGLFTVILFALILSRAAVIMQAARNKRILIPWQAYNLDAASCNEILVPGMGRHAENGRQVEAGGVWTRRAQSRYRNTARQSGNSSQIESGGNGNQEQTEAILLHGIPDKVETMSSDKKFGWCLE